jgi:hypothetical protein
MTMRQGRFVEATLIVVPSSKKAKKGERDPEMHQTRRAHQWYFGLIHSVVIASVHVDVLIPAAKEHLRNKIEHP